MAKVKQKAMVTIVNPRDETRTLSIPKAKYDKKKHRKYGDAAPKPSGV